MTSLSFSLGGSSSKPTQRRSSPPPPKTTNGTKRHHAALLDDASDDEDANHSKRQTITHFDSTAGGAVDARAPRKEEKKPLVITALANRDWREASKRQRAQKYGITTEQLDERKELAQNAEGADKVVKETEAVKYGLNVFAPSATASAEDTQQEEKTEQSQEEKPEQQKTADQLAIDALTGAAPTSTLTIPTTAVTEEDAFNDSFHSAPPAPSLSDYAAVPVEEYGAAMLRGMGWKGPSTTPQPKPTTKKGHLPPAKRPALLGIGADPNAAAQAEELGAWGKSSSSRGRKEPTMFIPVSMKNKKTGETLTEEELRDKIRRDKEEAENQRFVVNDLEIRDKKKETRDEDSRKRRDDYYSDNDEEEEKRRRRKDRERDHDRHDHRSRDYDRKDKRERDSSRDRDYHDKKSSSRRDRSRNREYERRDREYEKSSSRRGHRYEDSASKSTSRRDRSRDRDHHRSSRR
ncbi:hypothetical protein KCU92_g7010, partial [Aureobasidium melanogenum]|jgi:hypothetical protein